MHFDIIIGSLIATFLSFMKDILEEVSEVLTKVKRICNDLRKDWLSNTFIVIISVLATKLVLSLRRSNVGWSSAYIFKNEKRIHDKISNRDLKPVVFVE